MYFFIIFMLTIATASSIISARTLVGYNNIHYIWKILVFLALWLSWLAPVILNVARRFFILEGKLYSCLSFIGYGLFGFAFILMMLILFREILWYSGYGISKLSGKNLVPNPTNIIALTKANIITVVLAVIISFYALYQGIKLPAVKEITIASPKIKQEISIMQINDMHMDRNKPYHWFENMINLSNSYNPDIVVLPGDIIDDNSQYLAKNFDLLGKLKSKYGVYFSVGNHEFYNGFVSINNELEKRGIKVLSGNGEHLDGTNIYLAGTPDLPQARKSVAYPNLLSNIDNNSYKLLLSHNPITAQEHIDLGFDLVLSGHTHGGQIFPFSIPAKYANKYLAGLYDLGNGKLHISRGAGYWGPPMRLLAPSDITLIRLIPEIAEQD